MASFKCSKVSAKKCKLLLLSAFSKLSNEEFYEVVAHLSSNAIDKFCEILFNMLYGSLPIPAHEREKLMEVLSKEKADFKFITQRGQPLKSKQKRLQKQAKKGNLSIFLKTLLPVLQSRVIKKKP